MSEMNKALTYSLMRMHQPDWLAERFWPRVNKTAECWLWTGPLIDGGYGQIHLGKFDGGSVTGLTHRLSWLLAGGLLYHDRELDHLCRVRECCNPDHLESVTGQVNMLRAYQHQTHCIKGHEFTPENIQWCGKYKTKRNCRTCNRAAMKAWRARKKGAVL